MAAIATVLLVAVKCPKQTPVPVDPTPCSPEIATGGPIFLTTPSRIVFQRDPATGRGAIQVHGLYDETAAGVGPSAIEARWGNGDWEVVDESPESGQFQGSLTEQEASAGRQSLQVRFANATDVSDSAEDVGIGDVVLIWGQSNAEQWLTQSRSSSLGASAQRVGYDALDPDRVQWASGSLFRCVFGFASIYPLLLDRWITEEGVPVMTVAGATSYTGIVGFQPGSAAWSTLIQTLHDATMGTMHLRLVIGLQGESDVGYLDGAEYAGLFLSFFDALQGLLAHPTPFYLGIIGSIEDGVSVLDGGRGTFAEAETIREAQRGLPTQRSGVLCRGPEFSGLPLVQDHLHFGEPAASGLLERWWDTLLQVEFGELCPN